MGIGQNIGGILGGIAGYNNANALDEELLGINPTAGFSDADYQTVGYEGDFTPTLFDDPEAAQYQTISEDPRVRQVEMDALQSMIDRASGAADAKSNAAQFGAMDEANQLARGREGAIRQSMARRGQTGSGMDAVLQAQAGQSAANRARAGTQDAVTNAAIEKMLANNQAMAGAGSVRGQDFQRNAANSDIVNRFNQFNTQARNAARQANVGMQNDARMRNVNTKQGLAGTNTGIKNQGLNRSDANRQKNLDNRYKRFGMHAGLMNQATGAMNDVTQNAGAAADQIGGSVMSGVSGMGGGGGSGGALAQTMTSADGRDPRNDELMGY